VSRGAAGCAPAATAVLSSGRMFPASLSTGPPRPASGDDPQHPGALPSQLSQGGFESNQPHAILPQANDAEQAGFRRVCDMYHNRRRPRSGAASFSPPRSSRFTIRHFFFFAAVILDI